MLGALAGELAGAGNANSVFGAGLPPWEAILAVLTSTLVPLVLGGIVIRSGQSVTESVTEPVEGVGQSRPEGLEVALLRGESGSGGRTRTYDQAVNSRPLYH